MKTIQLKNSRGYLNQTHEWEVPVESAGAVFGVLASSNHEGKHYASIKIEYDYDHGDEVLRVLVTKEQIKEMVTDLVAAHSQIEELEEIERSIKNEVLHVEE